jgi:GNAT superfamily N-acetyltransferase/predicted nucleic acid-binding protein
LEIATINENSPLLDEVIELGSANSATLGFLPYGAYFGHAAEGRILVALDEGGGLLGYLLYGINNRSQLVYITHLCVKEAHRGQRIAKALVDELKQRTCDDFRGIRVRCRREYEANRVWPKFGFVAASEMPGRSQSGSKLTVWWFDHEHPTLFSYLNETLAESKLRVALDANVFFDLQSDPTPDNEESQALLASWMDENVELCLTCEIHNEINRDPDETRRKQSWAFADTFTILPRADNRFQQARQDLRNFFPEQMDERDESDLRQLARTVAADVQILLTRDEGLLQRADQLDEECGIHVVRPVDLIIHQDALMREYEYQPVRLAGSQIVVERVSTEQSPYLENSFRQSQHESRAEFRRRLQRCLADPRTFETSIVQKQGQPLALLVYGREQQHELTIPVFRIVRDRLSATLARHLTLRAILTSSSENRVLTNVCDPYLASDIVGALQELGFISVDQAWMKANLLVAESSKELVARLLSLDSQHHETAQFFRRVADVLERSDPAGDIQTVLGVEKSLWPAKITDLDVPVFMVPIRPVWAMNLFDVGIAAQDLFGAEPSLIFNIENVYYRSSRQRVLSAPARILWYVSKGAGRYQETMSVRACSYLDEVVIDKPKPLFSRFRRLGVYRWEDVLRVAGGDMNREIMAFRFSGTETFEYPVDRSDLRRIWMDGLGRDFHPPMSPVSVPKEAFLRIYRMGLQIE